MGRMGEEENWRIGAEEKGRKGEKIKAMNNACPVKSASRRIFLQGIMNNGVMEKLNPGG